MKLISIIVTFTTLIYFTINAVAQDYPTKPVKIIIPFSQGSITDIIARGVSKQLAGLWKQSVLTENLLGKGGTIAASFIAKEQPDGYTLFVHGAFTINPSFYRNLSYEPLKDFTHITPLARQPLALVVNPTADIKTLSDLIAVAKSKPRQINFGSPGTGSGAHLIAEKFRLAAGIDMGHTPYNGGPEVIKAINVGHIIFSFLPLGIAKKFAAKGKLRVVGVTSVQRTSAMPEVATISEAGLTGFEYNHWWGLWGPADIPRNIVHKIHKDVARSLATPELRKLFSKIGVAPMNMTSTEFSQFVHSEMKSVAKIIATTGIKPN